MPLVKGVVDEKVFSDVRQGVAMTVLVRRGVATSGPATVRYREMRGTREQKYEAASSMGLADDAWATVTPTTPYWSFAPASAASSYETWPLLPTIFPINNSGMKTERDDALSDTDRAELERRIRFVGDGTNTIEDVRHDDATDTFWVNGTQSFTGVPLDAWTWGEGFRPLEHFLVEGHGRTLDTDQIQGFQSAIHAVRECIRLGPGLDAALNGVLADPLDFGDAG